MARRKLPEINASSNADIAFLLLIFFLVTTTMDVDTGIARKLPPPPEEKEEKDEIKDRNVFNVMINGRDWLLVEGEQSSIEMLKQQAKEFLANPYAKDDLPEKKLVEIEDMPGGTYMVSKGIISLQSDRGTSYDMYIQVQDKLTAAFNELRNELSKEKFGMSFEDLKNDEVKAKAIIKAIPMAISEAEPSDVGGN